MPLSLLRLRSVQGLDSALNRFQIWKLTSTANMFYPAIGYEISYTNLLRFNFIDFEVSHAGIINPSYALFIDECLYHYMCHKRLLVIYR